MSQPEMSPPVRSPSGPSPRLPFIALALLLALLVAALGGTSFQRKAEAFQPLGFEAVENRGTFEIVAVEAPETGLRVGDLLLVVQDRLPADGGRLDAIGGWRQLEQRLRDEARPVLLVQRQTAAGSEIVSVDYERPPLDVDVAYLILTLAGIVYLLIGLYTVIKEGRAPARLFYFWCLLSAALYVLSPPAQVRDLTDQLIYQGDQLARTLLPALTLHLFLVFPTPLTARRLRRLAAAAAYLPAMALLAFHVDQIHAGGVLFGRASESTLALVDRLEIFFLVSFSFLSAVTLFVRLGRSAQSGEGRWEERRQVQWIAFGFLGGYTPFLLLYVLPHTVFDFRAWWTELLGALPLALVPLGFAYAVLKYKLWDIGLVLRDTVAYSATVLIGLCGFALIHLGIDRALSTEMAVARNFLTFAAGLAIAGVLVPTRSALAAGLERLQYRQSLPNRRALGRLGAELLFERDLTRLCTTLVDRLAEGLLARANLYLVQSSSLMAPVVPEDDLPDELAIDALGGDVWDRDVRSLAPVTLPGDGRTGEEELFVAGYRYAFPLLVREHRVGLLLVSYKFDGEPLSSEDLELSRGLLNQASLAIENARLLDEVHRRLEEVERAEEHTRGLIESSPVGIALIDAADRVVEANATFAEIVSTRQAGIESRHDLEGRRFDELLPIRPLPPTGGGLLEVSWCEVSGHERHAQLSVAPYSPDEPHGGGLRILTVQDVSELHVMELALKEKERLAALGLLAAGVAHEVNTPLTGISSYAQLLLSDLDESHPHWEILKKLERQTFRAAQIVQNLLEFSRNRHDELKPVNLTAVLDETIRLLRERLAEEGIVCHWQPPENARSLQVLGHEGELHQVFTNLMVNAIDAMQDREGHLTVRLEARDDRVVAHVSDTGPGIPPERLERIFQPFFSSKVGQGGTGLGLAITYNIVRRHRGEIRVENHPGGCGCTFTVELPGDRPD